MGWDAHGPRPAGGALEKPEYTPLELSGHRLHRVIEVDLTARLYLNVLLYLESWERMEPGRVGGRHATLAFLDLLEEQAARYPYVFRLYRRYPQIFDDIDHPALREMWSKMPEMISPWGLEQAVHRLVGMKRPVLGTLPRLPTADWKILELAGTAGAFSALLCRLYPDLDFERNCTVLCRDHRRYREGVLETSVAGVMALLSGAGEGAGPRTIEDPGEMGGARYDLIVGARDDPLLSERFTALGPPERRLTPAGELLLVDSDTVDLS